MLRVLTSTTKIITSTTLFPPVYLNKHIHSNLFKRSLTYYDFSEGKGRLPRNKEQAWMMQEQQKLRQDPNDTDDGQTYSTFNRYGLMALIIMGGSFLYLINWAERQSDQNLDFYEQQITGLKELKDKSPEIGGDWTLIDTEGKEFSSSNLSGYYYLVYFGFTNCPDICPSVLYYLSTIYRVIRNIPEGAYLKLKIVFISIDPQRDTPAKVKQFLTYFNKNMIGVTATSPQDPELTQVMKKFKISKKKIYRSEDKKENYNIDHTTRIFLMDPSNNYLYHLDSSLTEQQAGKAIVTKIVQNEHKKDKQIQKMAQ